MAPTHDESPHPSGRVDGWADERPDGADAADRSLDPSKVVDAVARRSDFLAALADGPVHKPALQSELNVSRSTVYKAIRELEELRLVERTDRGYRTSLAGRLLLERYDRFRGSVQAVCEPAPLLAELPPDCPISLDALDGAEVVHREPHAPHAPIRAFQEFVDGARTLRSMSPVVLPSLVEPYHEQVVSGRLRSELILGEPLVERLLSEYAEGFLAALSTGRLTVWETEWRPPMGLVISDDPVERIAVLVYDRRGELRGLLSNDTERAHDWATDVWSTFREGATDVTDDLATHAADEPVDARAVDADD